VGAWLDVELEETVAAACAAFLAFLAAFLLSWALAASAAETAALAAFFSEIFKVSCSSSFLCCSINCCFCFSNRSFCCLMCISLRFSKSNMFSGWAQFIAPTSEPTLVTVVVVASGVPAAASFLAF